MSIFNFSLDDVVAEPYPHIVKQPFLAPDLYEELKRDFPADQFFLQASGPGGRSGRDLYRGDPGFDSFLASSAPWRRFYREINSKGFLDLTLELFGSFLPAYECRVEVDKARFSDFVEVRETMVERGKLHRVLGQLRQRVGPTEPGKDDIFCRFDIHQGGVGYGKEIHCDRPNRLVSMVIYFCDGDSIGLDGGDLSIYRHRTGKKFSKYERHPRPEDTDVVASFRPKDNLGVFFLCSNNSYHGVSPIKAQEGYRNFVYINLSSKASAIW